MFPCSCMSTRGTLLYYNVVFYNSSIKSIKVPINTSGYYLIISRTNLKLSVFTPLNMLYGSEVVFLKKGARRSQKTIDTLLSSAKIKVLEIASKYNI